MGRFDSVKKILSEASERSAPPTKPEADGCASDDEQTAFDLGGLDPEGGEQSGELTPVLGVSLETWAAINAAVMQGTSLDDVLKGEVFMGYHFHRNAIDKHAEHVALMARAETKTKSKYPGVKGDVDLSF